MSRHTPEPGGPQTLSVKRAQVEFHNFASLGEPERAMAAYRRENDERGGILRKHIQFLGPLSPFLEIGANVGHTSYLLANEFGADGFALDISADALRHGVALQEAWELVRAPVRLAGDAVNLPFRDGTLRMVLACQMLSQFMDIEKVFVEVKRVLAPGGTLVFIQEPIRRLLSLWLYRCPYWEQMKPWERKLFEWGLLGYLVKDVIGAYQEDNFGIRQNHRMRLNDWDTMIRKHFAAREYEIFVADRGWGERIVHRLARLVDRRRSDWLPAKLLGGAMAALCRKEGTTAAAFPSLDHFEAFLRCPDCHAGLTRDADETLRCAACGFEARNEGRVYNLLPSAERKELYPGDRPDIIDFSVPGHAKHLLDGWYELEGRYGALYRWMGGRAGVWLERVREGPQRLRMRGNIHEFAFQHGRVVRIAVTVNGARAAQWSMDRPGLAVLECDVPAAQRYVVEIEVAPVWQAPPDQRTFGMNLSMIRLIPRE